MLVAPLSMGQKKMNLYFKDGTTQLGYVTFKNRKLQLREKPKSKKTIIEYALLDSASLYIRKRSNARKRKPKNYYFLGYKDIPKRVGVYQLVEEGKVNVYKMTDINPGGTMLVPSMMGGAPFVVTDSKPTPYYAVKRKDETYVTIFKSIDNNSIWKNFKKQTADYFSDCPLLVDKIQKREKGFRKEDIRKIIKFYNTSCQ